MRLDSALGPSPERRQPTRPGEQHWLALLDVDHFKQVNDRFGHLYGDEVLLLLARMMRTAFRQHDGLLRFGGEEFVMLLEPTSYEHAFRVLERFRKTVEHYAFPQVGRVTASIGFAGIQRGDPPSVIIGRADEALYYAKHHGRNQVCSYERLLESGALKPQPHSGDAVLF